MIRYDFLSEIPLFKGLTEEQLAVLSSKLELRYYKHNEVIIKENETGDELYILNKGKVKITKCLTLTAYENKGDDREKSLNILDEMNHPAFGEVAMLHNNIRSATVSAVNDCELLTLKRSVFEKLADDDARMGYIIIRNIAVNLSETLKKSSHDVIKLATAFSLVMKCE